MVSKKWSIIVVETSAYVLVDDKPLSRKKRKFGKLLNAKASDHDGKACIKLNFEPGPNGQGKEYKFNMAKYSWSDSNGGFKEIVGMGDEEAWVKQCNKCLVDISGKNYADVALPENDATQSVNDAILSEDDNVIEDECDSVGENCVELPDSANNNSEVKRKASTNLVDRLEKPSKRLRNEHGETAGELLTLERIEGSRISGQFHISVNQIDLPSKNRMLREVDEVFLSKLENSMEQDHNGAYEPLFVCVKDLTDTKDFDPTKINDYRYEVLGGTHNFLAAKALYARHADKKGFSGRYAWLFVGLTDDDALWLATRHNKTGSFRHQMTFQDEVNLANYQLRKSGKEDKDGNFIPSNEWRANCSHILGKSKTALFDVYSVALLPETGVKLFVDICKKYEKGKIKDQRAVKKDMIGKPTFRQVYVRSLQGLKTCDRVELLRKVAVGDISLEELKDAAKELKLIRPIQAIISSFLGEEWDVIEQKLPEDVTSEQLHCFAGKNETNCIFKSYLEHMHHKIKGDEAEQDHVISPNHFWTTNGHQGIVHKCDDPTKLDQSAWGQKNNGFSLAIYKLPDSYRKETLDDHIGNVLSMVERVNFGVRQFYNFVILGSVEDVIDIKNWFVVNRGASIEIGYYTGDRTKVSGNLGMKNIVRAFLVYHASASRQILPEHFNFLSKATSNLFMEEGSGVYNRIVELFSFQNEWVLDINSPEVAVVVAALTTKRNGLCFVQNDEEELSARRKLSYIS